MSSRTWQRQAAQDMKPRTISFAFALYRYYDELNLFLAPSALNIRQQLSTLREFYFHKINGFCDNEEKMQKIKCPKWKEGIDI